MTMSVGPMMGTGCIGTGGVGCVPTGPGGEISLLPEPQGITGDDLTTILAAFSAQNEEDTKGAKLGIESKWEEKRIAKQKQAEALEKMREAQESGGLFNSIGVLGIAAILTANPVLLVADMTMHMAHLTPPFLKDFEKENQDTIALASKLCVVAGGAGAMLQGMSPQAMSAAVTMAGVLIQETAMFGKDASDWIGTAMMVAGGGAGASAVVFADKDSAVADKVQDVEKATEEYNKWITAAAMALAGAAAIVGSLGTATAVVVAVGVAISAAGFLVSETKALDGVFGEGTSQWIGLGMMVAGAVVTGVGASAAASNAPKALNATSRVVTGASSGVQGLKTVDNAFVQHEASAADREAKKFLYQAQRLQRFVEDLIDSVRDLKDSHRRISASVNEMVQTQCDTQLMAASALRG
jgi:uncharacterized protein YoxC